MKMKIAVCLLGIALLTGCGSKIVYEGEKQKELQVEDKIADKLEVANPGKDIEVNISVGVDD